MQNFKKIVAVVTAAFMLSFATADVRANNIQISNVQITPDVSGNGWVTIQFNVRWDNSWYLTTGPSNYDAAWIFIKWRLSGTTNAWKHVYFRNAGGIHTVNNAGSAWGAVENGNLNPSASGYDGTSNTGNPGMGFFIRRTATETGSGNTPVLSVSLRWYYGDDFNGTTIVSSGLTSSNSTDLRVYGVEMVNVPTGPYYLGSGGTETYPFYTYPTTTSPYLVNSAGVINVGATNGYLNFAASGAGFGGDPSGNIPATYPNGYNSFYCMKYEMSMQQFVDFLNAVPSATAAGLCTLAPAGPARYNLSLTGGVYSTTVPYISATFVKTEAILAFLDWAALRPMTELEYEKACRGSIDASTPKPAVANEYAWGTAADQVSLASVSGTNLTTEASATTNANSLLAAAFIGTARSGIFATSSSTRVSSGATFYGIMGMSGSVFERVVSVGTAGALLFNGSHGDGNISTTTSTWPSAPPSYNGYGFKGGSWLQAAIYGRISDRLVASTVNTGNNGYSTDWGGRGVRTK
jgi:formylglycine-generating enzyme required for sulfatase activity